MRRRSRTSARTSRHRARSPPPPPPSARDRLTSSARPAGLEGPPGEAPPVALPERTGILAAFSQRGFRLLWTGAFLSSVGTWTQDVALAWLVHEMLKEPFWLGLRSF